MNTRQVFGGLLLAAVAWVSAVDVSAGALPLVARKWFGVAGKPTSEYSICLDAAAPATVKLAAEELQRAVEQSTGIRLPIANTFASPMICLGENAAAREAGLTAEKFPDDGFRIVTRGKNLYIFGRDTADNFPWKGWESRGTLYGTYEFIERVIGVRWVMPGVLGEEIPRHEVLKVPNLDVTQAPDFEIREIHDIQNQIRSPNSKDTKGHLEVDRWLLRHKCANVSDAFKSSRQKILHGHAWSEYIKPEDIQAHPDWQAVSGSKNKFCTTKPELVQLFAQRVIEWLDQHPRSRSVPVAPEDGGDFCKCETCKALTEKDWHGELSYTPVILKFYNDVARIVGQKYPDRMLGGYVYYNYMYPPRNPVKMEPNVYLFLAPLPYYGWGLAKPALSEELPKLISAWTAITPNFNYFNWSVWFRSLNGTPLPPGLPILKLELPTLHRCGVKGVGMIGIGAWGYGGCENYILARLMWDADADADALYREWLQFAYGPAWQTMDRFTMLIEARFLERKRNESPKYSGDNYEVNFDLVEKVYKPIFPEMERLYLEAMAQVATDKQRQRLAMLGDNLVMLHYNMRKANMFAEPDKSTFYRTDAAYAEFLGATEFALSMYRDHGHRDTPLLFRGSFDGGGENPPMEVRKVNVARLPAGAAAPVIDGDLADSAWQAAGVADQFRSLGGRDPVKTQTMGRLLFDAENLYIGLACQASDPAKIAAAVTERDGNVFTDDCVEIFLAVFPNARQEFWHLALSAGNTQWDGIGKEPSKNLAWTSAVRRAADGWTAEIVVSFKALGMNTPPAGKTWNANLARSEPVQGGAKHSTWNAVYRSFLEPYSFGEWALQP